MRQWIVVLLLLPLAAAHPDHEPLRPGGFLNHVQMWEETMAPGTSAEQTLAFGGFVLAEGWLWLAQVETDGNITVSLSYDTVEEEAAPDAWQLGPGTHIFQSRLATSGFPVLNVTNHETRNTSFSLYYDQTCNCLGKFMPALSGPVWFNTEAEMGQTITYDVLVQPTLLVPAAEDPPLPERINITIEIGQASADGRHFIVEETRQFTFHPTQAESCKPSARWTGCFSFDHAALQDGRNEIRVWAEQTDPAWRLSLSPTIDVEQASPTEPAPLGVLVMLAVALFALAAYRRA